MKTKTKTETNSEPEILNKINHAKLSELKWIVDKIKFLFYIPPGS